MARRYPPVLRVGSSVPGEMIWKRLSVRLGIRLEIGAGLGVHLSYERLTSLQESNYYALELRENMAADIKLRFPRVQTIVGNCQQRLDFEDGHFDRILV